MGNHDYQYVLLFPKCFFFFQKPFLPRVFNPFTNKPWFLGVCSTSFLKTLREKEKLLVTSNFSFSTLFFTHLVNFLPFSSNLKLSSANSYSPKICGVEQVKIMDCVSLLYHVVVHVCYLNFAVLFLFNCALHDQGCRSAIKHPISIYRGL